MPTSTPHPDLAWYIEKLLATVPALAARPERKVMAGVYVTNAGSSFTDWGVQRTPTNVLRIGHTDVEANGTNLGAISLDAAGSVAVGLLTLPNLADPVLDDEATIAAVLAAYGADGRAWAKAITGEADRAGLFGKTLADVTRVPTGSPDPRAAVLKALLRRHFSYNAAGAYVARWGGAGRAFPTDTRPEWREAMLTEPVLTRDEFYCYRVVSTGEGSSLPATESVFRLRRVGDELQVSDPLWTNARTEAAPTADFVFFYAEAGDNVAIPESARGAVTPQIASYLVSPATVSPPGAVPTVVRQRAGRRLVEVDGKLLVFVMTRPGQALGTLPPGVEFTDEESAGAVAGGAATEEAAMDQLQGLVRSALCPKDRLVELAALPGVIRISPVGISTPFVDVAKTGMGYDDYLKNLGVTEGGEGVVVGIVDTGIDATHPAFKDRIEKVWDQRAAADASFPPPTGRGNGFGRVYKDWSEVLANSTDGYNMGGHGTHVAGIAVGKASGTYTRSGGAPAAKILFVATTFNDDAIRRGVAWIFREAGDRPCVVNLSLGGSDGHGHDGVDDLSLLLRGNIRKINAAGNGYDWVPGRVICVAAGNNRQGRWHASVDSIAAGAVGSLDLEFAVQTGGFANSLPSLQQFQLYCRPIPANVIGCKVSIRIGFAGATGPAFTRWFRFDPAGRLLSEAMGVDTFSVVNGPPPAGDTQGLVYTKHQFIDGSIAGSAGAAVTAGTYTIQIRNDSTVPIEVHGYLPWNFGGASVFFKTSSERSQVSSPGATYGLISVGASVNRTGWLPQGVTDPTKEFKNQRNTFDPATNVVTGSVTETLGAVAEFSNTGPMRGIRRTLTINAPGSGIFSARARNAGSLTGPGWDPAVGPTFLSEHAIDDLTVEMSGTSMATPMVTGTVACLLAKRPKLTSDVVAAKLSAAVTTPTGWDTQADGPGKLVQSKIVV